MSILYRIRAAVSLIAVLIIGTTRGQLACDTVLFRIGLSEDTTQLFGIRSGGEM
ncbi:MAG: hypothetical protein GF344_04870, partial [Chitinivibrionales bacterium]|nr:hypothetical protein [Chitinivibrionales bacterium]